MKQFQMHKAALKTRKEQHVKSPPPKPSAIKEPPKPETKEHHALARVIPIELLAASESTVAAVHTRVAESTKVPLNNRERAIVTATVHEVLAAVHALLDARDET